MTEIEKMFKNTGIEPIDYKLEPMRTLKFDVDSIGNTWTREQYMKEVPIYSPFTAEKQLKIIKLISKQGQVIIENWGKDNRGFNVTFRANSNLRYITMDCITRKTVEEALAQIVNDIWQDLTDKEKEEIRGILNEQ